MKNSLIISLFPLLFGSCGSAHKASLIAEGAQLKLVADGFEFTEGPAADAAGNVYFTDQPNNRIHKWDVGTGKVSVYMDDAGRANGLYFGPHGDLYACADGNSEIWKISDGKKVQVLSGNFDGKKFNGPNDLWVSPDGGIYFTDPYYKRPYRNYPEQPIKQQRVYYLSPDRKELKIAAEDLVKPNGIIGTPDGKSLFVADIEDNITWKYSIAKDGSLQNKTLFTNLGSDGMTLDEKGNVYLTGDGVTVFNSKGEKILHIPINKEWTANVTFGGKDHNRLFITAMDSLFSLEMNVKGAR
ncbi:MAG: SMP-30/gluconolactonase/LRE family protein [Salinimicrobium sp.]